MIIVTPKDQRFQISEPGHFPMVIRQIGRATVPGSLSKASEYLRLFQEVTRMITSALEVEKVLERVARKVPEVLGVDAATIRLLDPSGDKLLLVAAHGLSGEYLGRGPVDRESSVKMALTGTPVAVYDATADDRIDYPEQARKEGIKSILVAPIRTRGEIKGILRLLTRTHRRFDEQEIEFVTGLAEQCGLSLENARAYEGQARQVAYFKTLHAIGKALNGTLQLGEVLDLIVDRLPAVMGVKGCTLRLVGPGKGRLELMAASGLSRKYLERGSIDDELSTHDALKGKPVFIRDATTDPRNAYRREAREEGVASILAVPVIVKNRIIGVLRLLTAEPRHFTDTEINFATAVAEQGGIAIQNAINYDKISKLVSELEQHEDFLQTIIDSLDADLFVLDENFRIIMANRVFLEHHHMPASDIIGQPYHRILRTCDLSKRPFERARLEKKSITIATHMARENKDIYIEVTATPVFSSTEDRKAELIIGALRDITSHVRLQEESLARERLQGVIEMAGAAAHELNNPLSAALGIARLLMRDIEAPASQIDDLKTVIGNLERVSEITRKMTRITRYRSKPYVGDIQIIDIDKASVDASHDG